MEDKKEQKIYKNPILNWIEFRLPIISYLEKEYGDYPMPKNANGSQFISYQHPSDEDGEQTDSLINRYNFYYYNSEYNVDQNDPIPSGNIKKNTSTSTANEISAGNVNACFVEFERVVTGPGLELVARWANRRF